MQLACAQVAMISSQILFMRHEFNCEYGENFTSTKISRPTMPKKFINISYSASLLLTLVCMFGSSRSRHPTSTDFVLITPAETKLSGLGSMPAITEIP